jgi:hypothetical protein
MNTLLLYLLFTLMHDLHGSFIIADLKPKGLGFESRISHGFFLMQKRLMTLRTFQKKQNVSSNPERGGHDPSFAFFCLLSMKNIHDLPGIRTQFSRSEIKSANHWTTRAASRCWVRFPGRQYSFNFFMLKGVEPFSEKSKIYLDIIRSRCLSLQQVFLVALILEI